MKVDEKATKEARHRQAEAINRMNIMVGVDAQFLRQTVAQDQRWLSTGKAVRTVYRRWRMKSDPEWAARRARRKRQRRARKANR